MEKQEKQEAQVSGGSPAPSKLKRNLLYVVAVFLPLFAIVFQEVFPRIDFFMYPEVYTMIFLAAALLLVFLCFPVNQAAGTRWYDLVLGIVGCAGCLYVAFNWEAIYNLGTMQASTGQQLLGWAVVLVVLEAARRTVGLPMVIISIGFLVYGFLGNYMPGFLQTASFSVQNMIGYIFLSNQGIFGLPSQIIATIVVGFITFGAFLGATRAGQFYTNLALAAMGRLRGGAAKVAILCSALFATMTGDPVSNTGIVGPMTLPLMQRLRYDPTFSAATVAVASCGSMVMPPVMAAIAFLMAQMTGLGYAKIALAAFIPATLYYFSLYWQIDFFSAKLGYKTLQKKDIPKLWDVIRDGWIYLIPLAVLIYYLLVLRYSPAASVYRGLLALVIVSLVRKKDRDFFLPRIAGSLRETGISLLPTAAVSAGAGIIMAMVTLTGLGIKLSAFLATIAGGSLLVLSLITAVTIYIMGMGMAPIVSYILMAILVAPAMTQLGVTVLAAHFFILYISISTFITPPFALASYMAAAMVNADGMRASLKAMRLGIVCYMVPFVSVFDPALLLVGSASQVIWATFTAACGIILLSAGLEGYLFRPLAPWRRLLFLAGGVLLFIPGWRTDLIGIVLGGLPLLLEIKYLLDNRKRVGAEGL